MVRNILVEGIDCAGKSTLVKELKNKLCWDVKSLHHRQAQQFERYLKEYCVANNVVFERGHLSEIVYSRIFSRLEPFNKEEEEILNWYCRRNFIVIFAIPSDKVAIKRYRERNEEMQVVDEEKIQTGNKLFTKLAKKFPNVIVYRSSNFAELNKLIKKIIRIIKYDS